MPTTPGTTRQAPSRILTVHILLFLPWCLGGSKLLRKAAITGTNISEEKPAHLASQNLGMFDLGNTDLWTDVHKHCIQTTVCKANRKVHSLTRMTKNEEYSLDLAPPCKAKE